VALVLLALNRGGYEPDYIRVETAEAMATALTAESWDIVICDYSMPQFSGPAALELLQESGLDLPFILISGNVDDEMGARVMTAGAHDFLEKGRANRLLPVIERELRDARERAERRKAADALEKYMSPKFYDLIQRGGDLRLGGDSHEITVLKTDIRDFTARAEGMEPEELIAFLNRYFTGMVEVIH